LAVDVAVCAVFVRYVERYPCCRTIGVREWGSGVGCGGGRGRGARRFPRANRCGGGLDLAWIWLGDVGWRSRVGVAW